MNNTKKITQGAMLLAIYGAMMLIDKLFGNFFDAFVVLFPPIIIIIYSLLYQLKDGVYLSFGVVILTFILAGLADYIYTTSVPAGIIVALILASYIKKGTKGYKLLYISILVYIIAETFFTIFIYPIYGYPIFDNLNELSKLFLNYGDKVSNMFSSYGLNSSSSMPNIKILFELLSDMILNSGVSFAFILLIIKILTNALSEAFLLYFLCIIVLKRLKIADITKTGTVRTKPNTILTYVCFVFAAPAIIVYRMILGGNTEVINFVMNHSTIFLTYLIIGSMGFMVLFYFGYLYCIVLYKLYTGVKPNIFVLLFILILGTSVLPIIGFLYGTGPLNNYLEKLKQIKNQ